MRYTLEEVDSIIFNGFDYKLPEETIEMISKLAIQVGSPDYVRTPVFQKRENILKSEQSAIKEPRKKRGKAQEIIGDDDWEAIRNFQPTKIEEKSQFENYIDSIRVNINKLTDKNYIDIRNKIIDIIEKIILENNSQENMLQLSSIIFDIASTNRFYSKNYAELYSELYSKYVMIRGVFQINFDKFIDLFNNIEYVDPKVDYDKFCNVNKMNEKRKSIATFYLNLMNNGIIPDTEIMKITRTLLHQVFEFISIENKKNEVEELTETIAILYKKELYLHDEGGKYEMINGLTINGMIEFIAKSKIKDFKSLTNKALFKFMDLIDM